MKYLAKQEPSEILRAAEIYVIFVIDPILQIEDQISHLVQLDAQVLPLQFGYGSDMISMIPTARRSVPV